MASRCGRDRPAFDVLAPAFAGGVVAAAVRHPSWTQGSFALARTIVSPGKTAPPQAGQVPGYLASTPPVSDPVRVEGSPPVADLLFFTGTMDSGKSTLALQTNHNHSSRGRVGRIFTAHDRAGTATLSSRLGLTHDAAEVTEDLNFWNHVVGLLTAGGRVDYLICDEAQFYAPDQVDQLAKIVDELSIDVFAFGILTDFRGRLFPATARLVELADRMLTLQVEALCWCGERATHNARTEDGVMVTDGEVIVVGDVEPAPPSADDQPEVAYEVLCRRHHRRRLTAARARATSLTADPLPFG
jgi:thymidine kinase